MWSGSIFPLQLSFILAEIRDPFSSGALVILVQECSTEMVLVCRYVAHSVLGHQFPHQYNTSAAHSVPTNDGMQCAALNGIGSVAPSISALIRADSATKLNQLPRSQVALNMVMQHGAAQS